MDSSAPRLSRPHALSLTTIASKLAPTQDRVHAESEVTCKSMKAPRKGQKSIGGVARISMRGAIAVRRIECGAGVFHDLR
jgi:hypothetical protein